MTERDTILVADDVELNRVILRELLCGEYKIIEAKNGQEAIELVYENINSIAMILLDIIMPVRDGFFVLRELKEKKILAKIPVVLITAEKSIESEKQGHDLGASDIITKPFDPYIVKRRIANIIDLYQHKNNLEHLVERQTEQIVIQSKKLTAISDIVIDALSTVIEYRSLESGQHIRRIRTFTRELLKKYIELYRDCGISEDEINVIASASAMHDIGKIAIPDSVLLKPGKLTSDEFEVMKTHSSKGCEILKNLHGMEDLQYLNFCYEICRYHHERWDGRGYPDGLSGNDIPICAQVVSIADVYDALTNKRVYKPAFSHKEAVKMILNGECGEFAPNIINCFKLVESKLEKYSIKYADNCSSDEPA